MYVNAVYTCVCVCIHVGQRTVSAAHSSGAGLLDPIVNTFTLSGLIKFLVLGRESLALSVLSS